MKNNLEHFHILVAQQMANESSTDKTVNSLGIVGSDKTYLTIKGFRNVLNQLGLNLSYQDMCTFSLADEKVDKIRDKKQNKQ